MSGSKYDGVIEAVRYKKGQILWVRAYERRGATFSDIVLIDRKTLLQRIAEGRRFVTGRRRADLASTFSVGKPVKLVESDGRLVVTTASAASRDELEDVPLL